MWISKKLAAENQQDTPFVQSATVTLNNGVDVEVSSTGTERGVGICSPFGYSFSLPAGERLLLTHSDGEQTAIGVLMDSGKLETGEIKISSPFGSYIHLRKNGSVVINGLEINKDGVIVSDE